MIVDLNLKHQQIVIIGGGNEALKRINSLLKQECKIIVISDKINSQIKKLSDSKKIILKKEKIKKGSFLSSYKPYMVITTTNDEKLNKQILRQAKKKKIIAYSSDNPEESDFRNLGIIDIANLIQIAISTGGRSPAVSKDIKIRIEKLAEKIITKEDINQIKIQKRARELAKEKISNQIERKKYLKSIMLDTEIEQLIKTGSLKKAEKRAITILKEWK